MLHGDKDGVKTIWGIKKKLINKLLEYEYSKVKKEISKREADGWVRSTTPEVRDALIDSLQVGCRREAKSIRKAVDLFCLVYDSDDPYAYMFHRFINQMKKKKILDKEKYIRERKRFDDWWNEVEGETKREKHEAIKKELDITI